MVQQRKRGVKATEAGLQTLNKVLIDLGNGKRLTNQAIADKILEEYETHINESTIRRFLRGNRIEVENAKTICNVYHQQSLEISEEIGYRQGVAISLHNMGETLIKLENYSEAENKIQESLVISQDINYRSLIAEILKFLAEIAHKTDRPELALTPCQEALELSKELGIPLVKDCEELLVEIQDTLEED